MFDAQEKAFLRTAAPHLAAGIRRALLVGEATDPDHADAPGLVILDERWRIESATPGAARWLAELPGGDGTMSRVPPAVVAVAAAARQATEAWGGPVQPAVARVLSGTGRWVVLHGSCLDSGRGQRTAVIVEAADHGRIYPLLASAYGLTERERDVTRMVLAGSSTTEIANTLTLSAHTVQQHLKGIFEKTGVRSRRDLVGKVFFAHYEPRLRDNEQRVATQRPVRGGPMELGSAAGR